jgi:hypothetical protein
VTPASRGPGIQHLASQMTDYDATAHISEEVRRAAYAGQCPGRFDCMSQADIRIFQPPARSSSQASNLRLARERLLTLCLVIGTGVFGWILNIVLVLCSGPIENLPGISTNAFLSIMVDRMGKAGALTLWVLPPPSGRPPRAHVSSPRRSSALPPSSSYRPPSRPTRARSTRSAVTTVRWFAYLPDPRVLTAAQACRTAASSRTSRR